MKKLSMGRSAVAATMSALAPTTAPSARLDSDYPKIVKERIDLSA